MHCTEPKTIHTIGHSTRSIKAFIDLLKAHEIELLVDVRRWPSSNRYPHFGREAMEVSLKTEGVDYLWRGDLGGFRKPRVDSLNTAWKIGAFRAYADFMLTPEFDRIMQEMDKVASAQLIVIMCAEAVPWRCHRQLLADAFVVRGWSVRHIIGSGEQEHKLPPFAAVDGTRIYYSGASARLPF